MGLRGPARTPTAILHAQGSRLAASRAGTEPRFPAGAPKCPAWLPRAAKAEWKRVAPLLAAQGVLTVADQATLAGYCVAVSELQAATLALESEGRRILVGGRPGGENGERTVGGQWQPHPAVSQQRSALQALKQYSALFGLDPSSRSRVQAAPAQEKPTGKSRFFGGA